MFTLKNKFFILFGITVFSSYVQAQEADSMKKYELQEVVISANRTEQNFSDCGRAVIVITKEKLKSGITQSIGQILEKEAGIYLTGTGQNFGASQRMYIRGANSYHVLVMIDGVRISDPSSVDNGPDLSEIPIDAIQRIEIVKGSHSSYYGSSAIGGIVNIITVNNSTPGLHKSIAIGGGTFGKSTYLLNNSANLHYQFNSGFYLKGGILSQISHGLDATIDTSTNPMAFKNRDRDNYNLNSFSLGAGFQNDKLHVFGVFRNVVQQTDLDDGAFRDDDNRFIHFQRNLISWGCEYKMSKTLKFNYSAGYSLMQRMDIDDSSVVDYHGTYDHTYSKSTFDGAYLTNDIYLMMKFRYGEILTGLFHQAENMNNRNYIFYWSPYFGKYELDYDLDSLDIHSSTKGGFIHVSMEGENILKNLKGFRLETAGRFSNHSRFGNVFTWSVNPSLKINKNSLLFISLATGFNAPSLYRLFSPDMGWGAVVTRGNPSLKPEHSVSIEFGIKSALSQSSYFEAVIFNNTVRDVIEYVYLWDKNIPIDSLGTDWMRNDYRGDTYINLSKMKLSGIEIKLSSFLSNEFKVTAFFSLMNGVSPLSTEDIDTAFTKGNHVQLYESGIFITEKSIEKTGLVRRPDAVAGLSFDYSPVKSLSFSLSTRLVGHRYDVYYNPGLGPYGALDNELIKGYFLADFDFRYQLRKNLNLRLKIENLLNTKYMEINGFSTRPRGLYLALHWE